MPASRPFAPLLAAALCLAAVACRSPETPTADPAEPAPAAAATPATGTPEAPAEPPPLDSVPPQTIAADLPVPAPEDEAALDAARTTSEQLVAAATGADERLATGGMPDAAQLATTDLLRKIAVFTQRKARVPFRVVHAPLWDELVAQVKADLAAPDSPARASRVRAAATLLGGDTPWERATGMALMRLALAARLDAGGDPAADAPLRDALLARVPLAPDAEERRYAFEILATAATDRLTPVFIAYGRDDDDEAVRRDALAALNRCVRAGRCRPEPGALRAIYRHTMPESVHSALVDTGAALKMPAVTDWCAGDARVLRSLACRSGLAEMETPEAFERLLPYVEARDADPMTHSGRHYGFRDDFALLDRYADAPYATERYYTLLDRALARVDRNGFATGFVVRRMATLGDAKRALALLRTHRPAYVARWGEAPTARSLVFLYAEINHAIASLEARIAGREPPPRPPLEHDPARPIPPGSPPAPGGL